MCLLATKSTRVKSRLSLRGHGHKRCAHKTKAVHTQCRAHKTAYFEASLAGETGILGPCLCRRGCKKPEASLAGFWGLAYIRQARLFQARPQNPVAGETGLK